MEYIYINSLTGTIVGDEKITTDILAIGRTVSWYRGKKYTYKETCTINNLVVDVIKSKVLVYITPV